MAISFVLKQNLPNAFEADNPPLSEHIFDDDMFTVGSDPANSLVLSESASEQVVFVREGEFLTLINRAEGTQLNGQILRPEAFEPLAAGDKVSFNNYIILVADDAAVSPVKRANLTAPGMGENGTSNSSNGISPVPLKIRQSETVSPATPPPTRNFAEILDTMRTEEDSFYFIVKEENKETERIPLEQPEIPFGANGKGKIAFAIEQISTLYGVARKDWSGILLESRRRNSVFVNDEAVTTTRRLRNDDRVSFTAPIKCSLILHEPNSLVALESLLSARVASNGTRFGGLAANNAGAIQTDRPAENRQSSLIERRYFNYFSFIEVLTMIIGTLIGAVLFFLFFEFMFS
ncbi:MAG: FHA domain-containing protein [Actinomycetota bacterium]